MDKSKLMVFNDEIDFLFHTNIVEYDMVAASVSVCERYKLLPKEKIEWLKLLPKDRRTREMGMMQKDKEFSDKMISGLLETRDRFIEVNQIKDSDIISLHSDALFFVMKHEIENKVNNIEFKMKNQYCAYMKYDKHIEMFYTGESIDFKQVNKDLISQHALGINMYLNKIFEKIENYDETVVEYIAEMNSKYLQDKLPDFFYLPWGKLGKYKIDNLQLFSFLANVVIKELRSW